MQRVRILVSVLFLILIPAASFAAPVATEFLQARDTQAVSRGDFLRAAVKASALPTPETGSVPYDGIADTLLPYVRAAETRGALKIFASEGRTLNLTKNIRRGEALSVVAALLQATLKDKSKVSGQYTDARNDVERTLAALAIEKQWMKPSSPTLFGLNRYLRGKEAKLFLTRAFSLAPAEEAKDTITSPIIRVKITRGTTRAPAPKYDLLEEIWNVLRENYLYQDRLNTDKVGDKVIEGLLNSLNDPYTSYMPKSKNDDFKQQRKGEVEGIGATVEMTGATLTIVTPLRGSPAEKAGLKSKDKILSVNGKSLEGLTLDEAVHEVRGPKGSTAVLKIRRNGSEFEVKVTRDKVLLPEVEIEYRDRGAVVVKLLQFWDTTDQKFREVMTEVMKNKPTGIVLDLRNNPGGLLHAAEVVMGTFLPKESPYVSIAERGETVVNVTSAEPIVPATVPMIVLINKGSASASEIVAGALQDAKRARLVGETTYGKGTVQQMVEFTDGSSLKYTIAEWMTPSGRKIDKAGVSPDIEVKNLDGRDSQMDKALELLR